MSFKYSGKERRKPYRRAKAVNPYCRNHGACSWCRKNRLHFDTKRRTAADQQLREESLK